MGGGGAGQAGDPAGPYRRHRRDLVVRSAFRMRRIASPTCWWPRASPATGGDPLPQSPETPSPMSRFIPRRGSRRRSPTSSSRYRTHRLTDSGARVLHRVGRARSPRSGRSCPELSVFFTGPRTGDRIWSRRWRPPTLHAGGDARRRSGADDLHPARPGACWEAARAPGGARPRRGAIMPTNFVAGRSRPTPAD